MSQSESAEILLYILESEEFKTFYKKYILPITQQSENSNIDLLENYIEKVKTPECYIAILGIQGAGKSSLLNALIFGETILPVEVHETTCIPTMVRRVYSGEEPGAEIHYQDEHLEKIPLKVEFLEKVVDNRFNPGNIMDAAYVVCKVNSPFLKEGFVFVDLPGVGSLTEKNEQTSVRFLQDAHIGIFLLRTVPPITESEAGFIKIAWPRVHESIFVQNVWAKETEQEVKEGMEHNEMVLKKIAEQQNTIPPGTIIPVNVAMACQGTAKDDAKMIEQSGLKELKKHIKLYANRSFTKTLHHQTAKFFLRFIDKAQQHIEEQLAIFESDRQEILKKLQEAQAKFAEKKQELEDRVVQHCEQFLEKISFLKTDWLSEKLDETTEQAVQKIDKMPLEDLKEEEFRQSVRETFNDLFGVVYKQIKEKLAITAEEHVKNLGEALQQISSAERVLKESFSNDPARKKDAKGWSIALAGSVAPLLVGTGPVGWSILGGSVLVGGMVRWISEATAHKRILRNVKTALGEGKRQIRKEIVAEIDHFAENVIRSIKESIRYELDSYQAEMAKIKESMEQKDIGQEEQKAILKADMKLSTAFVDALKKVTLGG